MVKYPSKFPPSKEDVAKTVWEHVERELTNLDDARAARIDTLLTQAAFEAGMDLIKNRSGSSYNFETDSLEAAGDEDHHVTNIFPEGSDETLTFTAGGVANTFGSWTEIIDSAANKFSDKIIRDTHISAFMIESSSVRDKVYVFEIAYGDAKTLVAPYRFIAGETIFLPAIQQIRIRSKLLPPGELVYYRMKCETAGATCILHIRHFPHRE